MLRTKRTVACAALGAMLGCSSPASSPVGAADTGTADVVVPMKEAGPARDSGHDATTGKDSGHDAGSGDAGPSTCIFDQAASTFDQACVFGN